MEFNLLLAAWEPLESLEESVKLSLWQPSQAQDWPLRFRGITQGGGVILDETLWRVLQPLSGRRVLLTTGNHPLGEVLQEIGEEKVFLLSGEREFQEAVEEFPERIRKLYLLLLPRKMKGEEAGSFPWKEFLSLGFKVHTTTRNEEAGVFHVFSRFKEEKI